ncbi:LysR family transcriptional regulator [Paraburkholderia sp. Ac-20336]|uniref:LysR substrate-binding domain-containing protein n=1 Tax=Burkholderiaceae TaxID=119060 RepID=UPI00142244F4|nr:MULTISPECIES: LysR substrate-binding domain-containing protein [Burkholderiaceae]MBN3802325.1 LysR family transcriptional regulator [Paraburkholderia sp. Ac-20336]MBN3845877.1 LysR family transcriptional regulator [Paraburkholderia sp. Ac-20342]NIF55087.1 LysR family transcriptional regulator [Burkholderia sp. Ax-1724]NIF77348.1 LysR family transcriptional regulator [Paraburkholderia sp. Cy-641]
MLDLKDVYFFVQVADRGGFTSAGDMLGVQKSTLSHRIKELEAFLGVRLINRTSRQFSMTEVGAEFYQYAVALLRSAEVAEEAMRQRLAEPSGVIRITAPIEIAQYILRDVLPAFLRAHPKVSIHENATDRLVDIVGEGYDLAIRGHATRLQDSNLIQRPLTSAPWYLFASPEYLEQNPPLERPEQLEAHTTLSIARKGPSQWQLQGPSGELVTVPIAPRYQSNNLISLKEAASTNLGIAALPGYICRAELQAGTLRQLLPGWIAAEAHISALIPYRKGLLPAVRSLVDFLAAELPRVMAFGQASTS